MRWWDHYTGLWQRAEPSFLLPDVGVGTNDITKLDRATKISGNKDGYPDIFHIYQDVRIRISECENDDDNDDDDDGEACGGFSGDNKSPTLG